MIGLGIEMKIYEITLQVDSEIKDRFERFMMERHIPDLLGTGCFVRAQFAKSGERYRVWYESVDLERYLAADAERLRTDFVENFPDGVVVERDIWETIALFGDDAPR